MLAQVYSLSIYAINRSFGLFLWSRKIAHNGEIKSVAATNSISIFVRLVFTLISLCNLPLRPKQILIICLMDFLS